MTDSAGCYRVIRRSITSLPRDKSLCFEVVRPSVRSLSRPDHDISGTAWAISMKLTRTPTDDLVRFWTPEVLQFRMMQVEERGEHCSPGFDVAVPGAQLERHRDSSRRLLGPWNSAQSVRRRPRHQGTFLPQSEILSTADARTAERHPRRCVQR